MVFSDRKHIGVRWSASLRQTPSGSVLIEPKSLHLYEQPYGVQTVHRGLSVSYAATDAGSYPRMDLVIVVLPSHSGSS